MPTYTYQCSEGHLTDLVRRIDERNAPAFCMHKIDVPKSDGIFHCGKLAHKIITPTMLCGPVATFTPYESPSSGKMITSVSDRDNDLKATGYFISEPGVKEQIARNKADLIAKDTAAIGKGFRETFAAYEASNRI